MKGRSACITLDFEVTDDRRDDDFVSGEGVGPGFFAGVCVRASL